MKNDGRVVVRLPKKLREELESMARASQRSLAAMIRCLLNDYFRHERLSDLKALKERKNEPGIPFEEFLKSLK